MIRYFRGELKSDPFWINKKSNAAILSKRHQGVRVKGVAVWGIFYLPPGYFDTHQSELLRVTRSVAKFLCKLVNNILRAIKITLMSALHRYLVCSGVDILS